MKKAFMICIVVLILCPFAYADQYVDRYVDILEPGNPGGWENSLKTWDVEYSMNVGDTIEFDVWLGDEYVDGFVEVSYYAIYDPSQLSMSNIEPYDGLHLPGPWDPEHLTIISDAGGPGTYFVDLMAWDYCPNSDSEGHMIIARGLLQSKACGDATITFHDIPAF